MIGKQFYLGKFVSRLLRAITMLNSQRKVRLGDYVVHQKGFAFKSSQYTSAGHPIIRVSNFTDRSVDISDLYFTSDSTQQYEKFKVRCFDVVIATVGSWPANPASIVGKTICIPPECEGALLNQNAVILRGTNELEQRFLFYLLKTQKFQEYIVSKAQDSANQASITLDDIFDFEFELPTLEYQKFVISQLRTLDDKIELNRKMNKTLEAMAQALFKSWFVDFEPVKSKAKGKKPFGLDVEVASLFPNSFEESKFGLIPKGWEVSTIENVCIFLNGYAFKSNLMTTTSVDAKRIFKMGNIIKGGGFNPNGCNDYYPNSEIKNLSRYLAQKGDLLMCMTDMKNNVALLGNTALMPVSDEYLVNQRVGLLRTKEPHIVNHPFLFLLTNESTFLEELRSRANSGVQVNLSTEQIKKSKFILPSVSIHKFFDKIALPIFEKIEINCKESEYLKNLRNLLLPKLISGQIRIKDAEKILGNMT